MVLAAFFADSKPDAYNRISWNLPVNIECTSIKNIDIHPHRFRREKPPQQRRCYCLGVVVQKLADELSRSCWLLSEHHVRMFGLVEAEELRQFGSNVHPVDYGDYLSPYTESYNLADPPELSSLFVIVGEFNQRRKNFFDYPGALVFVVCEDLQNSQFGQKLSNSITNVSD